MDRIKIVNIKMNINRAIMSIAVANADSRLMAH